MARYLKTSLTKQARVFVPYFFVLLGMHSPDAFELIKSSQQNEKTPFIKILAAHCCCYNRLSHAMTLWSSGTDECGHQSQLPLKRKGFDSLHFSVLYWTQTLNPNAFTSQANANSNFEAHVSSQVPLLLLKHRKQAWVPKGVLHSHMKLSVCLDYIHGAHELWPRHFRLCW